MAILSDARRTEATTRVWDPFVRFFHWGLVTSFGLAWVTAHSFEAIHHAAGYVAAALIGARMIWGVIGTPYARFSQFVRHPAAVLRYLRAMLQGREARYIGHNPAGGAMVMLLISTMAATAITGWMTTTDTYYGVKWVEDLHELSAHAVLILAAIHIGGVFLASFRHRENLVVAMITGRKRVGHSADRS